jgi:hypothetical protein
MLRTHGIREQVSVPSNEHKSLRDVATGSDIAVSLAASGLWLAVVMWYVRRASTDAKRLAQDS